MTTPEAHEVEALAAVIYEADRARHQPPWSGALDHHREPFRHMARAALDFIARRDVATEANMNTSDHTPETHEVEALAMVLHDAECSNRQCEPHTFADKFRVAKRILASDWLAQRDAALVARAKAEALREAAEVWAEGAWSDAFAASHVVDDISAVQAMEWWLIARAEGVTS